MGIKPEPRLIHSTDGHPIGIPIELADIVLRTAGICENYRMDLQEGVQDAMKDVMQEVMQRVMQRVMEEAARQDPACRADPGSVPILQRLAHQHLRLEGETMNFVHLIAKCHHTASRAMTTSELTGAFKRHRRLAAHEIHRPGILTDLANIAIWAMFSAHHQWRVNLRRPPR